MAGSSTIAIVEPGERCITPDGRPLHITFAHGLRHWGNSPDGPDTVIVAGYADAGSVGRFVTDVLPEVAVVPGGGLDDGLIAHLHRELGRDGLGQSVVLTGSSTSPPSRRSAPGPPPIRLPGLPGWPG